MNPLFLSVALGHRANLEVSRLSAGIPGLTIITDSDPRVSRYGDDQLSGLLTKAAAAGYFEDHYGPVVVLDADLIPNIPDPFAGMVWPEKDVAFVPYPNSIRIHHPNPGVAEALEIYPMPNSGLVVFRNGRIAAEVSRAWASFYRAYLDARSPKGDINDEWSLLLALREVGVSIAELPATWNDWGQFAEPVEGAVFTHRHATDDEIAELDRAAAGPSPSDLLADAESNGLEVDLAGRKIRLACGDRDRALFSSALVLYKTHEDLMPDDASRAAFRDSQVTFADVSGTVHVATVDEVRRMLVAYGAAYQSLWAAAVTG